MSGIREQAQTHQNNRPQKQKGEAPMQGNGRPWRRVAVALVVASLGLNLASCGPIGTTGGAENPETEMSNQFVNRSVRGNILVSKVLPVRLRLRRGWQAAPENVLHDSADLQAYNPDANMFLLVLGENRSSVAAGSLDEQATRYIQIMKTGMTQVLTPESRTDVSTVGTSPAVQYELRGEVLSKSVAYLHTTVELDENYYQIVVWTPDERQAANASEMQAIVQGFGPDQR
ncbi:MAG: hypothetical protein HC929_10460 [Leptolyngbyaceae cyanobacterium SM2_5_2]|nr:hypothetical protein [Leptolyngbyaceae cyanobacterium SM2_5_2]